MDVGTWVLSIVCKSFIGRVTAGLGTQLGRKLVQDEELKDADAKEERDSQ